ncbi:MAG: Gfo/Idh/MocA family oxidoreductase [Candidatus Accumulibacter sp.]|nr:Gfo/Idh/MocA family oxidoreductase [Accumulibacter sp.]
MVITALDAGYAVICEKALATSSTECRAIGEAVARNRGFLAVTYNYSGYPMVRELRRLIAEGHLGRLHQIHIEMPQEGFLRQGATPQAWRLQDYAVPTVSLDLGRYASPHSLCDRWQAPPGCRRRPEHLWPVRRHYRQRLLPRPLRGRTAGSVLVRQDGPRLPQRPAHSGIRQPSQCRMVAGAAGRSPAEPGRWQPHRSRPGFRRCRSGTPTAL